MEEPELDKPITLDYPSASHAPGDGSFREELVAGFRLWARHTFSMASLLSGLKSLVWVAPLSVIIWVYAEQNDVSDETEHVVVSVVSADPSRVVRLVEPADGRVTFTIRGSNPNRQRLKEVFDSEPSLQIQLPQSTLATPGDAEVSPAIINDMQLFRDNGITVSEIAPQILKVNVEAVLGVDVDVQAAPDGTTLAASFTPRKVHVMAPDSVIEAARKANKLVAYAHVADTTETLTPGPHDLKDVPITLAFGDKNLLPTPATVAAHVDVRKDVTWPLPSIPVYLLSPPGFDDKYRVVYETTLPNVTVIGPEEQIRALQNPNSKLEIKAYLEVSAADLPVDMEHERRLRFELPEGIRPSPDDAQRTIKFTLSERKGSE
jgi:hypothetical protein